MQGFVDISLLCTFKRMRNLLGIQEDWKQDKVPEQIVLGVRDHLIPICSWLPFPLLACSSDLPCCTAPLPMALC